MKPTQKPGSCGEPGGSLRPPDKLFFPTKLNFLNQLSIHPLTSDLSPNLSPNSLVQYFTQPLALILPKVSLTKHHT